MAQYTIFGPDDPTGLTLTAYAAPISVSTAFAITGVTGWRMLGVRVWVPATSTTPATGQKAYLWSATFNTPDSILATADFTGFTPGQWNTVLFAAPVTLFTGVYYWAQVYFPTGAYGQEIGRFTSGGIYSDETAALFATSKSQVATGQGSYREGAAGLAPNNDGALDAWFGVDVLIDDGFGVVGPGKAVSVKITDAVGITRTGIPATAAADATATDALGLSTPTSDVLAVGGPTNAHTIRRAFNENRSYWGAITNPSVRGPSFAHALSPITAGLKWYVQWPVRFVGARFYKAPSLVGEIPMYLWQGSTKLAETSITCVADEGGWRDMVFDLDEPIVLVPDVAYVLSYYAPNGWYSYSDYVYHYWSTVEPPMVVRAYQAGAFLTGTAQIPPITFDQQSYYVEPIVEWDSNEPVFVPDPELSYYDQWVNGMPNRKFMIGVFYADPPYLQEYADMGVNTLIAGFGDDDYVPVVKTSGLDHYPFATLGADPDKLAYRAAQEDPAYAALLRGYVIIDEPEQYFPYSPPNTVKGWVTEMRRIDSTRPLYMTMGRPIGINQTFYHQPQGSTMEAANQLWREWASIADILAGDFYTLSEHQDPYAIGGPWTYGQFYKRLKTLNEGRTPIWVVVETTSGSPNQPTPDRTVKACWAAIIAGANGLVFFDHRFASSLVTNDFAAMLHDPPMKAAVTAMIVRINAVADALNSPDLGLVTAVTSSNMTSGPYGGTWGVPMHYTTRADEDYEYLFAMGIRPGLTTATFTIPSWAGETVTVLDESRTVVVDGSGVLTDVFVADYTVHLYQRAL